MQKQNIIRAFLFVVFFSIGVTSLSSSILLCDDLVRYYQNRQLLKAAQQYLDRLKSLNTDYDVLLSQLETEPNLIKRIAPATLGTEPEDTNAVYPKATVEQLATARKALADPMYIGMRHYQTQPTMPEWLCRCSEPRRRIILFFAGAGLIFISFICFGPAGNKAQKSK